MISQVLMALLLGAPVVASTTPAQTLAEGLAAQASGDFGASRRAFVALADNGSAIGETMLGTLYARGQGVPVDPATAASYWLRAANRGYAPAQLALARALAAGRGVARDPAAAWLWASLAARSGLPDAALPAGRLAAALRAGFDAPARAALDRDLAGWRPWATYPR